MRYFLTIFILFSTLLFSHKAYSEDDFDKAISDSTTFILKELKYSKKLENKRIAVFGFRDVVTKKGCAALSSSIANKITASIQQIKNFTDMPFTIVSRDNLESIEAEYLIKSSENTEDDRFFDAASLLEGSDILITGVWQNGEGSFNLTIKALEIKVKNTRELTSVSKTIDKYGLSEPLLDCLKFEGGGGSESHLNRALQEKIAMYNKQIEEMRLRKQSDQRKKEMLVVIEKQKKTINLLEKQAGIKGILYTTRKYPANLAFLNIYTEPKGLDVYIDEQWVGQSPLKMYEIEAGSAHTISAQGDPRYYLPVKIKRSYEQFSRIEEKLVSKKGKGKILFLGKELIDMVIVDGKKVSNFNPNKPVVEINTGKSNISVWNGIYSAAFEVDVWTDDMLRQDYPLLELIPMVFVKGGCYKMGDTFGYGGDNEKPVHEVCVDDFYIGKYEVTQGQWKKVMGGGNPSNFPNSDNQPVEQVSWEDAQEFIKKLNSIPGGGKYHLPTEAEWEYASSMGSGKKEKWAGTNNESELADYAWFDKNSGGKTHPVGVKRANGFGLYDMSGNVWEWCNDWYGSDYYKNSLKKNPTGPSSGSYRVYRGGSWYVGPKFVRASNRRNLTPTVSYADLGFRLARTP